MIAAALVSVSRTILVAHPKPFAFSLRTNVVVSLSVSASLIQAL